MRKAHREGFVYNSTIWDMCRAHGKLVASRSPWLLPTDDRHECMDGSIYNSSERRTKKLRFCTSSTAAGGAAAIGRRCISCKLNLETCTMDQPCMLSLVYTGRKSLEYECRYPDLLHHCRVTPLTRRLHSSCAMSYFLSWAMQKPRRSLVCNPPPCGSLPLQYPPPQQMLLRHLTLLH